MLQLEGHKGRVSAVAISADGKTVASGSWDWTVRLWSTATGEQTLQLEEHEDGVSAVAFSADGKTVASGSWDWTVRLWSTATGERIQCFQTRGSPSRVRFTNDGSAVETDVGLFDLGLLSGYGHVVPSPSEVLVVLSSPWVKYNGSDLLWLPHEYQGVCSSAYDSFLVIGQASGAMSFFSFKAWDSNIS